jgi:4-deoxy-L-threo-5-hexosulose-uronate ketol-isomerase
MTASGATRQEPARDGAGEGPDETGIRLRHAVSPDSVRGASTDELRERHLVEGLFVDGALNLVYSFEDRMVIGGAVPATGPLTLRPVGPINTEHFLSRREVAILHVGGGQGVVTVDGERYELGVRDCLFAGQGSVSVELASASPDRPARLYLVSALAHRRCPTRRVTMAELEPTVLGAAETSNRRRIYRYVNPDAVESSSLMLGVTMLDPGDTWNTMPPHTHDRRSEIYLYFDVPASARVVHLMGEPSETRHLVVANEQAVISPCWSIHAGSGTAAYTFCWAMAGENMVYNDMDPVDMSDLR